MRKIIIPFLLLFSIPLGASALSILPIYYEVTWPLYVLFGVHLYIGFVFFQLSWKLEVSPRWLAWVPLFNILLALRMAKKPWWWMVLIYGMLFVFAGMILFVNDPVSDYIDNIFNYHKFLGFDISELLYITYGLYFMFSPIYFICILLSLVCVNIAKTCGRPAWWGYAMGVFPPLGFVLLGILAFSRKKSG